MEAQDQNPNRPTVYKEAQRNRNKTIFLLSVLSGFSVALSILACLISGYTAQQVSALRQTIEASNRAALNSQISAPPRSMPDQATDGANLSPQTTVPTPSPLQTTETSTTGETTAIQPGQFVQNAFGTKAQVELLSVKRIKDPELGTRDVVNVQMRIRRSATDTGPNIDSLTIADTTARNPDTSETYKAVSFDRSTGSVSMLTMKRGASADAYVWLRVPEGINTIDIFVPQTAAFKNVPISG